MTRKILSVCCLIGLCFGTLAGCTPPPGKGVPAATTVTSKTAKPGAKSDAPAAPAEKSDAPAPSAEKSDAPAAPAAEAK